MSTLVQKTKKIKSISLKPPASASKVPSVEEKKVVPETKTEETKDDDADTEDVDTEDVDPDYGDEDPTTNYSQLPLPPDLIDPSQPFTELSIAGTGIGYKLKASKEDQFILSVHFSSAEGKLKKFLRAVRKKDEDQGFVTPRSLITIRNHFPFLLTRNGENLSNAKYQKKGLEFIFGNLFETETKLKMAAQSTSGNDNGHYSYSTPKSLSTKLANELSANKLNVADLSASASRLGLSLSAPSSNEQRIFSVPLNPPTAGTIKTFPISEYAQKLERSQRRNTGHATDDDEKVRPTDQKIVTRSDVVDTEAWLKETDTDADVDEKSDAKESKSMSATTTTTMLPPTKELKKTTLEIPAGYTDKKNSFALIQFISNDLYGERLKEPVMICRGCFPDIEACNDYRERFDKLMKKYHKNHPITSFDLVPVSTNVQGTPWYSRTLIDADEDNEEARAESAKDRKKMKTLLRDSLAKSKTDKKQPPRPASQLNELITAKVVNTEDNDSNSSSSISTTSNSTSTTSTGATTSIPLLPPPKVKAPLTMEELLQFDESSTSTYSKYLGDDDDDSGSRKFASSKEFLSLK